MIVILCPSYEEATRLFCFFLRNLYKTGSFQVQKIWGCSNCVETDEDLRYIFVDRRFRTLFERMDGIDFVDANEFYEHVEVFLEDWGGYW